jgi:hypothetical protein
MRDIRALAKELGADEMQLREFAVDVIMSLSNAIAPTTSSEEEVVRWLQGELTAVAKQIMTRGKRK